MCIKLIKGDWCLDDMRTIAKLKGAILVVGIDGYECCDLVKEVLVEWGCDLDVIDLKFPEYFYLKSGLVNVKGVIQFQTIKGMIGEPLLVELSQEMVKDLTMMCKSKNVPFLYLGDTDNTKNIKNWVRAVILSHQLSLQTNPPQIPFFF